MRFPSQTSDIHSKHRSNHQNQRLTIKCHQTFFLPCFALPIIIFALHLSTCTGFYVNLYSAYLSYILNSLGRHLTHQRLGEKQTKTKCTAILLKWSYALLVSSISHHLMHETLMLILSATNNGFLFHTLWRIPPAKLLECSDLPGLFLDCLATAGFPLKIDEKKVSYFYTTITKFEIAPKNWLNTKWTTWLTFSDVTQPPVLLSL